jgi:ATP-dependent Clp protease ATP-binding subunit ClpA
MINQQVEKSLQEAYLMAQHEGHLFLTLEHLLYALIQQPTITTILDSCDADIDSLKGNLLNHLEKSEISEEPESPEQTPAFQRVFQNALRHVAAAQKKEMEPGDLLASILQEEDSYARFFLEEQGVFRLSVLQVISQDVHEKDESKLFDPDNKGELSLLKKFTEEYTSEDFIDKGPVLVGRAAELESIFEIFSRKFRNNVIILGEPGVGKSALVKGLAQRMKSKNCPPPFRDLKLFSLSIGQLVSGTKYRGDFEERLFGLLKELKNIPGAILHIDEIHMLIGAGAAGNSSMDASNLLKPILDENNLRIIGSSTHEEFQRTFGKDRALNRRFQNIMIQEPAYEEARKILKSIAKDLEEHHEIKISDPAIKSSILLSQRFMKDAFLPDKAIDLLDHASARQTLKNKVSNTIGVREIKESVSIIAKVPLSALLDQKRIDLEKLETELKSRIFSQDHAIEVITQSLRRHFAGLSIPDKTIGSFLLSGPTGVGKTELALQLATMLNINLIRFDMSEFSEQHSISRLLGAPPGYVGFGEGAQLTEAIKKNPNSILLLDEIEKAHPVMYDTLLQIMDNAKITDQNGQSADLQQILLLMTTNAGSRNSSSGIGFDGSTESVNREIKTAFAPEFRNRLDAIIKFNPLAKEAIHRVAERQLKLLAERLKKNNNTDLFWSKEVIEFISKNGYDPEMGARPMRRVIQRDIENKLADWILRNKNRRTCTISFDKKSESLYFDEISLRT